MSGSTPQRETRPSPARPRPPGEILAEEDLVPLGVSQHRLPPPQRLIPAPVGSRWGPALLPGFYRTSTGTSTGAVETARYGPAASNSRAVVFPGQRAFTVNIGHPREPRSSEFKSPLAHPPSPWWPRLHFANRASPPTRDGIQGQPDATTVRRLSSESTRRGLPGAGSGPARVERPAARRVTPAQRPTFARVGKFDCTPGRRADGPRRDRPQGARPSPSGSGPPRRLRHPAGRRRLPRSETGRGWSMSAR